MGFFYDDDGPKKGAAIPASQLPQVKSPSTSKFDNPAPAGTTPMPYQAPVYTGITTPGVGGDPIYDKVYRATSLEGTMAWKQINNFLATLKSVISDPILQFKAAFAQAAATGLTKEKFLSSFNDMRNALESEKIGFRQIIETKRQTDVVAKEAQIAQLAKQIDDYQAKITEYATQQGKLQSESSASNSKLTISESTFESVYNRRKAEIDQEEQKYTVLVT